MLVLAMLAGLLFGEGILLMGSTVADAGLEMDLVR